MKPIIIPAILVKNKKEFANKIKMVQGLVSRVQVDIMDGKFVKNRTIQEIPKTKLKYEVQLMVKDPKKYVEKYKNIAWMIIFHVESCSGKEEILSLIRLIRKYKVKVGIALNPKTKPERIKPYLDLVDLVLVMTVEPGFGGQRFVPNTLKKIRKIRGWSSIDIEVDGGIKLGVARRVFSAGANVLVAGSSIFEKKDIKSAIEILKLNSLGKMPRKASKENL